MRVKDSVGVACALVLSLAGPSTAATSASRVEVRIFQFRPGQLEIKAGTKVAWTNQDDITHTVTSGTPDTRDGRFGQRLEGKGAVTTVEFKEPGVYPYFCERHPSMRGEIRVD
jgi:plastocyanin